MSPTVRPIISGSGPKPIILRPETISQHPTESFSSLLSSSSTVTSVSTRENVTWKTLLSAPRTPSSTFTVGIASCAPRGGYLACHKHKQPELYHFTQGKGLVRIDGEDYEVGTGTVVFIPGDVEHGVENWGEETLQWLYVFAVDGFEEVVYRFGEEKKKGGEVKARL